ncbi:hypothetical protein [Paenibacillus sp. FSL L8-0463]
MSIIVPTAVSITAPTGFLLVFVKPWTRWSISQKSRRVGFYFIIPKK